MWEKFSRYVSPVLGPLVLMGLVLAGCATLPAPESSPSRPSRETGQVVPPTEETAKPIVKPDPHALTSLRLTEQARRCLESHRPDEAIRVLERAVNLDPNNGRNFYYLAEAWLMKDVIGQAREFNRLADIYLSGEDASWKKKVKRQKERIAEME
ncbi:MAG: hypothetical protein PVG49_15760 [Desulfobacteraceae bacterium]